MNTLLILLLLVMTLAIATYGRRGTSFETWSRQVMDVRRMCERSSHILYGGADERRLGGRCVIWRT